MRILFISRHFPLDLRTYTHGSYQRMGMMIHAMKEIAQLDILYYVPPEVDTSPEAIAAKEQAFSQHWQTPIRLLLCPLFRYPATLPKWQRHWQGIFNVSKQLLFFETSGPAQIQAFEHCLSRNPDIIFVHRLESMAPILLTSQSLPPVIFDLDDIEHLSFLRSLKQRPPQLERWLYGLQMPSLLQGELNAIRRVNYTFVCSERDRRYLTERWQVPGVITVPNAVHIPDPQPLTAEPNLLLLASYQYQPNVHAANFLLEQVWHRVYQEIPEAKLIIAGREPHNIRSYGKAPSGVEFTGFVEDLSALYRRTRVVCCPIFSGGGTRIKMVEAAAYGKPIVATTIGAEGLMMSDGQDFLLRNKPTEFADACLTLLQNTSLGIDLGTSARKAVIRYYNSLRIFEHIQHLILSCLRA